MTAALAAIAERQPELARTEPQGSYGRPTCPTVPQRGQSGPSMPHELAAGPAVAADTAPPTLGDSSPPCPKTDGVIQCP